MDPWPFVAAAYGLTVLGVVVASVWAWRAARLAERDAGEGAERD